MNYTKDIQLEFNAESDYVTAGAKQLDINSRYLKITPLLDGNVMNISGNRIVFSAQRPDKQTICNFASLNSDGTINVELTSAVLAVEGIVNCEIKIYDEDTLISSCPFYINVIGSIGDGTIVESEQYTELTLLINELREIINRVSFDEEIIYESGMAAAILEIEEKEYREITT